jgi:hypothetical protein
MNKLDATDLERRYGTWETDALLRAATVDADEFAPEAILIMRRVLEGRGIGTAEIDDYAALARVERQKRAQALTGIGGFLLVFIILFAIRSLSLIGEAVLVIGMSPSEHVLWSAGLTIGLLGAYGVYCCVQLIRKSTKALWHTNTCLTLWFIFWVANLVLQFITIGTYTGGGFPLAWALYFTSSKRVANTYASRAGGAGLTGLATPRVE